LKALEQQLLFHCPRGQLIAYKRGRIAKQRKSFKKKKITSVYRYVGRERRNVKTEAVGEKRFKI